MAGYSGTPLVKKLGIKAGDRVAFVNAPEGFESLLVDLPEDLTTLARPRAPMDFILFFTPSRSDLAAKFPALAATLASAGMLWISWPKKTSPLAGDLNENIAREIGLDVGLVDVKVCAIDDDWSGLKFVIRKADRP